MKHKHHIVPKHMGGSDDPSNLVELTIDGVVYNSIKDACDKLNLHRRKVKKMGELCQ